MKKSFFSTILFSGSLIVDQFIAVLATTLLVNIFGFLTKGRMDFLQFLISAVVFTMLVYIDSWIRGSSDLNKIKLNIFKRNGAKGVVAGLMAAIPAYVFAFFAYLAESNGILFWDFLGADLFTVINRFWQLPLSGLYVFANETPVYNFIIPLFLPAVSGIGYVFGLNRISIKQIIIYKKDKE